MKQIVTALALLTFTLSMSAQNSVPSVVLKDLDGNSVDTGTLENDGKPIVICFWATWCSPCKLELNTYQEYYEEWQEETGVKIYAVTIDDQRSVSRVGPYISSVEWDYEILLDSNKQLARAMGVNNVPHTFLVDASGKIIWQHNNYAPGDEEELHEQLLLLTK
jgi:cytochrome c biogenesis protein CcmG, thiol:disulfide interchange protein DsbE